MHQYRGFVQQKVNNAVVAHYLLYLRDLQLFESLYEIHGKDLIRLMESIGNSVNDGGDPFDAMRTLLHQRKRKEPQITGGPAPGG